MKLRERKAQRSDLACDELGPDSWRLAIMTRTVAVGYRSPAGGEGAHRENTDQYTVLETG